MDRSGNLRSISFCKQDSSTSVSGMSYSPKVLDHFQHPRHAGLLDAAAAGERIVSADAGLITRGDALRLALKIRDTDSRIVDARFQNFGSGLPIASSSCLCEMLIGKSLDEALKISALDLDKALDGLPELQQKRPVLALEALDAAIRTYRGQPARPAHDPREAPLCSCFQVCESEIEKAVRLRGLKTVDEITSATRAGGGCHTCHPDLEEILARCERGEYKFHISPAEYAAAERTSGISPSPLELEHNPPAPKSERIAPDGFVYPDASPVAALAGIRRAGQKRPNVSEWKAFTQAERAARIESVLEHELRPAIRIDGGDIQLVDLQENRVLVRLHGHCRDCHSSTSTLKQGVERKLQDMVWPELEVVEVT